MQRRRRLMMTRWMEGEGKGGRQQWEKDYKDSQ